MTIGRLTGVGVATLIPAVYQAADEVPGLPHGVGLAAINWLLRIGILISPPLVGARICWRQPLRTSPFVCAADVRGRS